MKTYDIIIAGGGIAGLSLAYHLLQSPLRHLSILIIDKTIKNQQDRTLCFWTNQPTLFDEIVYRTWEQLHICGENSTTTADLKEYRYAMIRSGDFYRHVREALVLHPNVTWVQGVVNKIADGPDAAQVTVHQQTFSGTWVFDSTLKLSELYGNLEDKPQLKMYAKGWEIDTAQPVFDPQTATLMDFRTDQPGETRFFYVLPLSEQRALVEFTAFSTERFSHQAYQVVLKTYLETTCAVSNYRILSEETGMIPMAAQTRSRRVGQHVMTIGTKGGLVKPTTGYGFMRIQRDSAAMVQSLRRHGHPFAIPAVPHYYRWLDNVMLQVMTAHGDAMKSIFMAMFQNNPIQRILRFLDEAATPWDMSRLVASLPKRVFLQTALGLEHLLNLRAKPELVRIGD